MRKFDKSGYWMLQRLSNYAIFVLNDKRVKNVIKKKRNYRCTKSTGEAKHTAL